MLRGHVSPTRDTGRVSPRVSIVVPVFNGMPYLRDLADALMKQDYPDLEIVFSETGSTDGSAEFLATLDDPRIRIITPDAAGAALNWTAATQAAQGEFIKLVCQDDLIVPDAITRQVQDLEQHPTAVMAFAPRDIIDARGSVLYAKRGCQGLRPGLHNGADVIRRCYLTGGNIIGEPLTVLFRREPLLATMPWDDSNPLMLDVTQYAKVAPQGDVVVRDASIGAFRVSTSSWSTRLAKVQRAQFARWQRKYATSLTTPPSVTDRARAWLGMERNAIMRKVAYQVLRMKGAFNSD